MFQKKSILAVILLVILIMNVVMLNKLSSLEYNIRNLQSQLGHFNNRINDMERRVFDRLKEDELISQHYYDIENVNDAYEVANISVNIIFNKLPKDSRVSLMYNEQDINDSSWKTVELNNTGGLNYEANLELSYKQNYDMQVLVEGNGEILSRQLSTIDLERKLVERIDISIRPSRVSSLGNIDYNIDIINPHDNEEMLKIKTIDLYIYYKNQLINQIDIMKEGEEDKFPGEPRIEGWSYSNSMKIEGVTDISFMEDVNFKVVVTDYLGREYTKEVERY